MADTGSFVDELEAIGTHVDVAAFGISRYRGRSAHITATIFLVPAHPGKYLEIDVFALLDVFFNGRFVDEDGGQRPIGLHLRMPPAHGFTFSQLGRTAMD